MYTATCVTTGHHTLHGAVKYTREYRALNLLEQCRNEMGHNRMAILRHAYFERSYYVYESLVDTGVPYATYSILCPFLTLERGLQRLDTLYRV